MNRQQVMTQLEQVKDHMKPQDYAEVKAKVKNANSSQLGYIAFSLRFHKFRVENRNNTGGAG